MDNKRLITIAIDGFSSSGKSTMAKKLAKTIGYAYIDTGAMYRAQLFLRDVFPLFRKVFLLFCKTRTTGVPRLEPGYEQDAVLRVKGCLYAHFTGPMDHSSLASQKLNIYAYEHEIELTGTTYSIYVNQDSENGVMDVFMETK